MDILGLGLKIVIFVDDVFSVLFANISKTNLPKFKPTFEARQTMKSLPKTPQ